MSNYKTALEHLFSWLDKTRGGNPIVVNARQELARLTAMAEAGEKLAERMRKVNEWLSHYPSPENQEERRMINEQRTTSKESNCRSPRRMGRGKERN